MGSIMDNDIVREKLSVHMHTVMTTWKRLQKLLQHESQITLDGKSLTIADVVAVARCVHIGENLFKVLT